MANHEAAINTFLNNGLRQRQLDTVLASNCVMDWFGRTFIGQKRVIEFYQNSCASYEHTVGNIVASEAFEDRPYHNLTRDQPPENLKNPPGPSDTEQWFDCETHSPVNLKDGQRTPEQHTTPRLCPPAPCRHGLSYQPDSDDDELEDNDDLDLSGFTPFDSTIELVTEKSPAAKKLRRTEPETKITEVVDTADSKFSELHYLEATGNVLINRPATSEDSEKRDCKIFVSYRIHKDDPSIIQIALIVYKSNSKNPKTRRNLMSEFESKVTEMIPANIPSRSRTVVKSQRKQELLGQEISSEPAKSSKATKRPMISKTSLRF